MQKPYVCCRGYFDFYPMDMIDLGIAKKHFEIEARGKFELENGGVFHLE